jgi:hypothetical protein
MCYEHLIIPYAITVGAVGGSAAGLLVYGVRRTLHRGPGD